MKKQFKFYRYNKRWYIDLPSYPGMQAELEMVAGADRMLDILSNFKDEIVLVISTEEFEGAEMLRFVKLNIDEEGGAFYMMDKHNGNDLNLEIWLCPVTKFVFNSYPKAIFLKPALNQDVVLAPFNKTQVKNLNAYQKEGKFHPFTCGGQPTPLPEGTTNQKGEDVSGQLENSRRNCPDEGLLIATPQGWVCPCGKYTQDWAHGFMAKPAQVEQ